MEEPVRKSLREEIMRRRSMKRVVLVKHINMDTANQKLNHSMPYHDNSFTASSGSEVLGAREDNLSSKYSSMLCDNSMPGRKKSGRKDYGVASRENKLMA